MSASLAAALSSSRTFLRVGRISYSAANPFLTSTPSVFLGRSRTCPMEAFTWKSFPRYLLIVFALAGDSTITRFFATWVPAPPVKKMTPVSMVADEEGPGQAAHLVAQFQLTETGEQLRRFKAAPGPEVVQAQGSAPPECAKQRIRRGLGDFGGDLDAELLGHVA